MNDSIINFTLLVAAACWLVARSRWPRKPAELDMLTTRAPARRAGNRSSHARWAVLDRQDWWN